MGGDALYSHGMNHTNKHPANGFTLIELSIVLVIMGLVAGGVMVGRDLIAAANLRATIAQIDSFKSAAFTFRLKYNQLPGDMTASDATAHGFTARTGATGHGDGNDIIAGCAQDSTQFGCETALFWRDLSQANLIGESFTTAIDDLVNINYGEEIDPYLPNTKMDNSAYFMVHHGITDARAFSVLPASANAQSSRISISKVWSSFSGQYGIQPALTPTKAYALDLKIDDGLPYSGTMLGSRYPFVATGLGFIMTDDCIGAAALGNPVPYAINDVSNFCHISFKFL